MNVKPKKSVENMTGYYVPSDERDYDVKIDGNENNYGPSPVVENALKNFDFKEICFYPYYGELTRKIANYTGISAEKIKVTNGADEAHQSVINTYAEPGDILLTVEPSFSMPEIYMNIQGGEVISVPFDIKYEFPVDNFIKESYNPKVKIMYLSSPNNPTGNVIKESDLIKIIEACPDKAVILDETYANYSGYIYDKYAEKYDNLFVIRSFSKDFALAGLRLGYIISNEKNINNIKKVVSPYSVNRFAMKAGIAALEDIKYFESVKNEVIESRAELKSFFENLGADVYDSEANFLLVDFGEKAGFVYDKLIKSDIIVKKYGKGGILDNHLRVTIPTKQGVEKIKKALELKPSLVFDMDGVLINAQNSYRIAIQKVYEKYTGQHLDSEIIRQKKNEGGMNNDWYLTHCLLKEAVVDVSYEEVVNVFNSYYWGENGLVKNEEPLFNKDFFEKLSKKYNLSIFTGRTKEEADYALKRFGIENIFYPVITDDDVPGHGKPEPDGLNLVKLKTISSKYYYFGDTTDDMKAAVSAGYTAAGVLPPQDKSEELKELLKKSGASFVLNSVEEAEKVTE